MRHRFTKSRAGRVMLGAVLAGALSGAGASFAQADGLSLDIEAGSGNPNAPVYTATVAPGGTLTLQVYAVITDTTNTPSSDGLGGLFASFDAASTTAGALGSLVASAPAGPFNYGYTGVQATSIAYQGTPYTAFSDGSSTHVGTGAYNGGTSPTLSSDFNSSSPTGWFFAAYLTNSGGTISSIKTGGTALTAGNGAYFNIGSLTYTAGSSTGTATVTGVGRTQLSNSLVAALWSENGVTETLPTGSAITSDSVTITVGSTVQHNPGDVNDNGLVGQGDLNVVLSHWNQTVPATNGWEFGGMDGNPTVDQGDLNLVLANWNHQYSDYVGGPGVVVVPEPASLGLLGVGALAMIRRRK